MGKTVKPYQADGSKKEQVSKMFDNIAPSYDLLNRLSSLGIDRSWRKKAIRLLDPAKAKTVLDVATGTADVAIEIARQLKPEKIIGVDIAQQMLEIGREKVSKRGLAEVIELQLGDSENLPFESNTFDAITVAFGVRNFEDLGKGLSEMQRVLKPGGKLVVLEFSRPRIFPFKQLFNLYFRYLLPLIGRLTSKDPKAYSYLYESVQAFPDRENFVTELGKAGYTEASYRPLTLGICSIYSASK